MPFETIAKRSRVRKGFGQSKRRRLGKGARDDIKYASGSEGSGSSSGDEEYTDSDVSEEDDSDSWDESFSSDSEME